MIFFVIATAISNIFRFDIFEFQSELQQLPAALFILISVLLEGSGVWIGASIAIFLLKKKRKREITFFGTSVFKSVLMAVIPIMILTITGVTNDYGLGPHIYGFYAITGTLIYCVMEEYGWRGFLQEELKSVKPWQKYGSIGLLWYLWHLSFLMGVTIGENVFFLGMMIFGSWGIGQVAELTKSILACACFHLIIQIMMFNALIKNGITGTEKLIVFGVSAAIWVLIMKRWKKPEIIVDAD